jgi:hypothetical protein
MIDIALLDKVVQVVYLIISTLAAAVVIWGVAEAIKRFVSLKFSSE